MVRPLSERLYRWGVLVLVTGLLTLMIYSQTHWFGYVFSTFAVGTFLYAYEKRGYSEGWIAGRQAYAREIMPQLAVAQSVASDVLVALQIREAEEEIQNRPTRLN